MLVGKKDWVQMAGKQQVLGHPFMFPMERGGDILSCHLSSLPCVNSQGVSNSHPNIRTNTRQLFQLKRHHLLTFEPKWHHIFECLLLKAFSWRFYEVTDPLCHSYANLTTQFFFRLLIKEHIRSSYLAFFSQL